MATALINLLPWCCTTITGLRLDWKKHCVEIRNYLVFILIPNSLVNSRLVKGFIQNMLYSTKGIMITFNKRSILLSEFNNYMVAEPQLLRTNLLVLGFLLSGSKQHGHIFLQRLKQGDFINTSPMLSLSSFIFFKSLDLHCHHLICYERDPPGTCIT